MAMHMRIYKITKRNITEWILGIHGEAKKLGITCALSDPQHLKHNHRSNRGVSALKGAIIKSVTVDVAAKATTKDVKINQLMTIENDKVHKRSPS